MPGESSEPSSPPSIDIQLEALLDSFLERFRNGERPAIEEYLQRRPELAQKILEVFPASTFLSGIQGRAAELPVGFAAGESSGPSQVGSQRLGEYRLVKEIGRGGMGVVYEAEQESLNRRVAVKVLPFHGLTD